MGNWDQAPVELHAKLADPLVPLAVLDNAAVCPPEVEGAGAEHEAEPSVQVSVCAGHDAAWVAEQALACPSSVHFQLHPVCVVLN